MDVQAKADAFVIKAYLPGVSQEDVDVLAVLVGADAPLELNARTR
ncbi:MAG TPA: Hsp20/alpha crystallin family protein [Anaerolineaceae bacterium]|nr:Hsp20/alpha crystallin family protein [Anaerolineaceae bacterium]